MKFMQFLTFVFSIVLINTVQSQEVCDFEDTDCILGGANIFYKNLIAGVGCVKPSDPLFINKIIVPLLNENHELINNTLAGLRNCDITETLINKTDLTYVLDLVCPKLDYSFDFDVKATLGDANIDGKGHATLTAYNTVILFKGQLGQFISQKDQKPHFFLKTACTKAKVIEKVVLETNDLNEDEEKAKETLANLNENWQIMATYFKNPILKDFMAILVKRIDAYLRTLAIDELFPKQD